MARKCSVYYSVFTLIFEFSDLYTIDMVENLVHLYKKSVVYIKAQAGYFRCHLSFHHKVILPAILRHFIFFATGIFTFFITEVFIFFVTDISFLLCIRTVPEEATDLSGDPYKIFPVHTTPEWYVLRRLFRQNRR